MDTGIKIEAGKYKWEDEIVHGKGAQAKVAKIPGQPDIVAMYTKSTLKYRWLSFNDLVLGESTVDRGGWRGSERVLILPFMEKMPSPNWYIQFFTNVLDGTKIKELFNVYPELEQAAGRGFISQYSKYTKKPSAKVGRKLLEAYISTPSIHRHLSDGLFWSKQILSFLDTYPEYNNAMFDCHIENIMSHDGSPFLVDPLYMSGK